MLRQKNLECKVHSHKAASCMHVCTRGPWLLGPQLLWIRNTSIPSKFLDYQDFYSWDSSSKIIRISIIRKLFLEPIHPDNRGPPVCIMCCRYSKQAVHFFVALKVIDCHGQRKRLLRRWWWQVVCRQILYAWYNNYKSTDPIRCPGGFKVKTLYFTREIRVYCYNKLITLRNFKIY